MSVDSDPTVDPTVDQSASPDDLDRLASLVPEDEWLTVPDVVDRLGVGVPQVRRMLDERLLAGVRRGSPKVLQIPRILVEPEPLVSLPGTLTVLADAGFDTTAALRWLFSHDDSLGCAPIAALRAGRIAPVRRRAQVLGF